MFSSIKGLLSLETNKVVDDLKHPFTCPDSGGTLEGSYDFSWINQNVDRDELRTRPSGIWRWHELLPVREPKNIVSLHEGDTPLIHAKELGKELGLEQLFILDESRNPTGSFKDRGGSVTISKCKEVGIKQIVLPSSGNAAACFSAYCARGGLDFIGFVRDDSSQAHCVQVEAYGAFTFVVNADQGVCGRLAEEVSKELNCLHATLPRNLYRVEGKKTIAYEIAEKFNWVVPDRVICPTAGGTTCIALEQGFRELIELGWIDRIPAIDVVQAEGCAPIVESFDSGEDVKPWGKVDTKSAGLTSPNPACGDKVVEIVKKTGGEGVRVSDKMNLEMEFLLAKKEGIFLQPASAASIASLISDANRKNKPQKSERIVCIGTGTGKNATEVASEFLGETRRIEPHLSEFMKFYRKK
jgi:threonine synthase